MLESRAMWWRAFVIWFCWNTFVGICTQTEVRPKLFLGSKTDTYVIVHPHNSSIFLVSKVSCAFGILSLYVENTFRFALVATTVTSYWSENSIEIMCNKNAISSGSDKKSIMRYIWLYKIRETCVQWVAGKWLFIHFGKCLYMSPKTLHSFFHSISPP